MTATPELCDLCAGKEWVSIPDPMFNGTVVDSRCPACCDLSVRAAKTCWENNWGGKVGQVGPQEKTPGVQTHTEGRTSINQERG